MRWLFVCTTGLQFLSAVSIIEAKQQEGGEALDVDLVLVRQRRETICISKVLSELKLFRKVCVLETEKIPSFKHIWKNPENFTSRLLGGFEKTRNLARKIYFGSRLSLKYGEYSDFFAVEDKEVSTWIRGQLSESCRIHHYEDGIGTYVRKSSSLDCDDFYLFEPGLSEYPEDITRRIRKISTKSSTIRKLATLLCEAVSVKLPSVLYIDQYWGNNTLKSSHASDLQRAMWNKRIELIDSVMEKEGKERCGILIHPGSQPEEIDFLKTRFGEDKIIDLEGIPFEIFLLYGAQYPEKIYTVSSSAAFYWKIACEIPATIKMVFLVNSFQFDFAGLTSMPKILEKLRQRYPDLVEIQ